MLDEGNAISIGCCRKRKQNTEEFESLNFHQTVRVINVLFTWQVEHGYRSYERCCNDFLCCLQANYPVLVINNTVWAHEWHRLHVGKWIKALIVETMAVIMMKWRHENKADLKCWLTISRMEMVIRVKVFQKPFLFQRIIEFLINFSQCACEKM